MKVPKTEPEGVYALPLERGSSEVTTRVTAVCRAVENRGGAPSSSHAGEEVRPGEKRHGAGDGLARPENLREFFSVCAALRR